MSTNTDAMKLSIKDKEILGALSQDLKRVALGFHRGSYLMAERFLDEALKRKNELDTKNLRPYVSDLLDKIENIREEKRDKAAEDALLYSTLFQNASQV